ncbi:MAG: DUF6084 family protein [Stellaceae bacterium]
MPDLAFTMLGVEAERYAVQPMLRFRLEVAASAPVENISLQCQFRIEPMRRGYGPFEHDTLSDLFGEAARWGETLKSFLWALVPATVPALGARTAFDVLVPCSFDFNLAATKYLHGIESGDVPLSILFSGSTFYRDAEDRLQIEQVSWSHAVSYRLPAAVWQAMMDRYYPNSAWLRLDRAVFDKLYRAKRRFGVPTFEQTLERLLAGEPAETLQ